MSNCLLSIELKNADVSTREKTERLVSALVPHLVDQIAGTMCRAEEKQASAVKSAREEVSVNVSGTDEGEVQVDAGLSIPISDAGTITSEVQVTVSPDGDTEVSGTIGLSIKW